MGKSKWARHYVPRTMPSSASLLIQYLRIAMGLLLRLNQPLQHRLAGIEHSALLFG